MEDKRCEPHLHNVKPRSRDIFTHNAQLFISLAICMSHMICSKWYELGSSGHTLKANNLVLFLNLRKKCKHVTQCCGLGPSQPSSLHSGSQGPGRAKKRQSHSTITATSEKLFRPMIQFHFSRPTSTVNLHSAALW